MFFFKWRDAIKLPQCFCVFLLLPFIFYLQDSSIPEIQAVDCLRYKCIEIPQMIQFSYLRFAPSNLLRFPRGLRHCAAWANSGECEAREQKFRIFFLRIKVVQDQGDDFCANKKQCGNKGITKNNDKHSPYFGYNSEVTWRVTVKLKNMVNIRYGTLKWEFLSPKGPQRVHGGFLRYSFGFSFDN